MKRRAWRVAAVVLAAIVLFACYWRQSLTFDGSSDGASVALQAWDMLHGNVLLHGWQLSDVSFYTTEVPQYLLIEAVSGLGPWVLHVAPAMTYTLLVLLAAVVARGEARGGEGLTRALLAAGIIVAPELGYIPVTTLLEAPDHTGSAVPVLAMWLVTDRCRRPGRYWIAPVAACLILGLSYTADSIVLLTGIVPLFAACAFRLLRNRAVPRWYELSLGCASGVALGLGLAVQWAVRQLGGYQREPIATNVIAMRQLAHGAMVTGVDLLKLFGADVANAPTGAPTAFAILHLAGLGLAAWAFCAGLWQFLRGGDLVVGGLTVGIVVSLAAYLFTGHGQHAGDMREMVAVLPFGAALTGRVLGSPLLAAVRTRAGVVLIPVLSIVAIGYLAALGYAAAQPPHPVPDQALAGWLEARGMTEGLGGYWQSNIITVDSGGRVRVSCAWGGNGAFVPCGWETRAADYDPLTRRATFYVLGAGSSQAAVERAFGRPRRVYHVDGYTVLVWDANLLLRLGPAT